MLHTILSREVYVKGVSIVEKDLYEGLSVVEKDLCEGGVKC